MRHTATHPFSVSLLSCLVQYLHGRLHLTSLSSELGSCKPNRLAFRVLVERPRQNVLGASDVAAKPLFLCSHEPKNLGARTIFDGFGKEFLERFPVRRSGNYDQHWCQASFTGIPTLTECRAPSQSLLLASRQTSSLGTP